MTERVWIELIQSVTVLVALLALLGCGIYIYHNETKGNK